MNKSCFACIIAFMLVATTLASSFDNLYADTPDPRLEIHIPEHVVIGFDATIEVRISNIEQKNDHQIRLDIKDPLGEETHVSLSTDNNGTATYTFTPNIYGKWYLNALLVYRSQALFAYGSFDVVSPALFKTAPLILGEPEIVTSFSPPLGFLHVGWELLVQSELRNTRADSLPFTYIVQVKDQNGITVSIGSVNAILAGNKSIKAALSFTPESPSTYKIETFAWNDLNNSLPLAVSQSTTVTAISHPLVEILKGSSNPEQVVNYDPKFIRVVLGTNSTVTWVNEDLTSSSVTSDRGYFDSGQIKPNEVWSYTFTKEGLYGYHSLPHPWMVGTVIVLNANSTMPKFWYVGSSTGYPNGSSKGGSSSFGSISAKTVAITKFNMSSINGDAITLHEYYFGKRLHQGNSVIYFIQSTEPVNFKLAIVDRKVTGVDQFREAIQFGKVIDNAAQAEAYVKQLDVQRSALYIFEFTVEKPEPIATVTFEVHLL